MKKVDFTYTGGFPFTQRTHSDMQGAYLDILTALLRFLKVPATGSHILFGCATDGTNIAPGMMYIDGDLCSFAGAAGNSTTKIKKLVTTENAAFENGTNNPVYIQTTAVVDGSGVALSAFTNYSAALVYDANYVHTDNNFTAALLDKLNGIAAGAEVNVQPNWAQVNNLADDFIKNKPAIMTPLRKASVFLGDFPGYTEQTRTITFPSVGTTSYMVLANLVVDGGNWMSSNDVILTPYDYRQDSFKISGFELQGGIQNYRLEYIILPL